MAHEYSPFGSIQAVELAPLFEVEELEMRLESAAWDVHQGEDGTIIIDSPV
jgi:hypothetical protein